MWRLGAQYDMLTQPPAAESNTTSTLYLIGAIISTPRAKPYMPNSSSCCRNMPFLYAAPPRQLVITRRNASASFLSWCIDWAALEGKRFGGAESNGTYRRAEPNWKLFLTTHQNGGTNELRSRNQRYPKSDSRLRCLWRMSEARMGIDVRHMGCICHVLDFLHNNFGVFLCASDVSTWKFTLRKRFMQDFWRRPGFE